MFGFWRAFGSILPLGVVGAGVLIVMLLAWRRLGSVGRRRVAVAFLVTWGLGVLAVTLRPQSGWLDAHNHWRTRGISLIPLTEISDAVANSVTWHVPVEQIGGNLILFMPLGVGLVMLADGRRLGWRAGFRAGAVVGFAIEAAQWLLDVGRVSSVDDVILACLGSGIGLLIGRPLFAAAARRTSPNHSSRELTESRTDV